MKKTLSLFVSLSQKFLLTFLLFCFFALLPSFPVLAAQDNLGEKPPWRDSSFGQEYDDADLGSVNAGAYVDRTTKANMASISCMILPSEGLCTEDPEKLGAMLRRSAVGVVSSNIAAMYMTPPADTRLFLADLGQTLGFVPKTAYAQGIGITGLSALLPLWKAFRNIAYLLMAIVMIVIGFMVMFRKKIDPKTVVTVQNAIPKIVVTLLLITFSYAIVGLMVDLMYLSILLVVGLFQSTTLLPNPEEVAKNLGYNTNQALYSQGGLLANIWNIFGVSGPTGNVGGITTPTNLVWQLIGVDPTAGKWGSFFLTIAGIGLTVFSGNPYALLITAGGLLPPFLGFIISLAIFYLVIRLFIFFLSSYLQIILALLFSPIQLLTEALPGSTSFVNWFKNLFSNLIVFPVGAVMFMLSAVFANLANNPTGHLWTPPFTPLFSASVRSIGALLSLGVLFTIPSIAGAIKEALKAKPFVPGGASVLTSGIGQGWGLGTQMYSFWHSERMSKQYGEGARNTQEILKKLSEGVSRGGGG